MRRSRFNHDEGHNPAKRKPEANGDDPEHDLQDALVRVEVLTKVAEQRAEADEDDREAHDERDRSDEGASATWRPSRRPAAIR